MPLLFVRNQVMGKAFCSAEGDGRHHERSLGEPSGDGISRSQTFHLLLVLNQPMSVLLFLISFPQDGSSMVPPEKISVAVASLNLALQIVDSGDDKVGRSDVELVVRQGQGGCQGGRRSYVERYPMCVFNEC